MELMNETHDRIQLLSKKQDGMSSTERECVEAYLRCELGRLHTDKMQGVLTDKEAALLEINTDLFRSCERRDEILDSREATEAPQGDDEDDGASADDSDTGTDDDDSERNRMQERAEMFRACFSERSLFLFEPYIQQTVYQEAILRRLQRELDDVPISEHEGLWETYFTYADTYADSLKMLMDHMDRADLHAVPNKEA